jgi:hypothetical protein
MHRTNGYSQHLRKLLLRQSLLFPEHPDILRKPRFHRLLTSQHTHSIQQTAAALKIRLVLFWRDFLYHPYCFRLKRNGAPQHVTPRQLIFIDQFIIDDLKNRSFKERIFLFFLHFPEEFHLDRKLFTPAPPFPPICGGNNALPFSAGDPG